ARAGSGGRYLVRAGPSGRLATLRSHRRPMSPHPAARPRERRSRWGRGGGGGWGHTSGRTAREAGGRAAGRRGCAAGGEGAGPAGMVAWVISVALAPLDARLDKGEQRLVQVLRAHTAQLYAAGLRAVLGAVLLAAFFAVLTRLVPEGNPGWGLLRVSLAGC